MVAFTDWLQLSSLSLFNVIVIDVLLAGDNALVVGMAAARLAPELRARVILLGIAGAVALRLVFAALASQLLAITGLTLAGGLLLLWVCWKMYSQLAASRHVAVHDGPAGAAAIGQGPNAGFWPALWQIILADVSMSLDNVLAVAGAAKGSTAVLLIGLVIGIALMAVASQLVAKLLVKHAWLTWIGLLIVLWVALDMIWSGWHEVERHYPALWSGRELWQALFGG